MTPFVLAKCQPGVAPEEEARRIQEATGLKALTKQGFCDLTTWYYLPHTGIPIDFGTTVILAFLVGVAVAGQAFYLFTVENLKQFGTLKAMGDSYTFRLGDVRLALTFAMDPSKSPRTIDLTVTEGPQKGQTLNGIYKLEGDMYTICRNAEPWKDRPTQFATRPDSGLMLVVWKRVQP